MELYIKDIAGNELAVGTAVAFVTPHYLGLRIGVVDSITKNGVKVRDKHNKILQRHISQVVRVG